MKAPFLNVARRKVAPEAIKRRRAALVSLSLVLLLFALAGGQVKDQATLLNLPFSLARPWVLLVAAWVIWAYFLYRFLFVVSTPLKEFGEEIKVRAMNDHRVWEMATNAAERVALPDEPRRHLSEGYRFNIARHDGSYHFVTNRLYRPAMQMEPSAGGDYGHIPLTRRESWTYRLVLLSATVKAMALETTFSDEVLPLSLVVITPLTWFVLYWNTALQWMGRAFL